MDNAVLLAQLRILLETAPDFDAYSPTSSEHQSWLARVHALINRWDEFEAIPVKTAANSMHLSLLRDGQVATVLGTIHRAIASLELENPKLSNQVFGPGAVYDFFKALTAAVESATTELFIVDPYLDDQIFDAYLPGLQTGVSVKLLANTYGAQLKPAVEKFQAQHDVSIQVRLSKEFHDRVIFIDSMSCWVMGQSIKDAAKAKPTYLAPLSADVSAPKLAFYESIWGNARAL